MAREQSQSGSSQFHGDSILFQGPKVPKEVQKMIPILSKISLEKFKKILQVVCSSFQNLDYESESCERLTDDDLTEEKLNQLLSGLYTIVKATLRQPLTSLKEDVYKAELLSYRFPQHFVEEIVKNTFGKSRTNIEKYLLSDRIRLPGLESLKWRVDVAISTSSLNRVLVPTVLMQVKSSDGKSKTFEISLSKFNELEYDVAYMLKEMEDLEKRSILKIE